MIDIDKLWAEAHTLHFDAGGYISSAGNRWIERMYSAPNGQLLNSNSFFETMRSHPKKVYILHVTRDLDKIIESSALHPSAGCLVGCIYGTQLFPAENNTFRMHNLGQSILTKEAPLSGKSPIPLIIEINYDATHGYPSLVGLNYLKLGKIHHAIYEDLSYLLSAGERQELESIISSKIKRSLNFIDLCYFNENNKPIITGREFVNQINVHVPNLAILGYMFFEAIAEFTMLFSKDEYTGYCKSQNEFNNTIYKSFLLDIYDRIGRFKLSDFAISVDELEKKLQSLKQAGAIDVDIDEFFEYIRARVSHMVTNLLLTDPTKEPAWLDISWDYNGFSSVLTPLVGHAIHRELRNFNRYKDFYFYFDQLKALSAWNYWNKMGISLPFNGPLQKGEIGINPAYQGASYRIYQAKNTENSEYLAIAKELKGVEIVPRLIDLRHTAMRSSDHNELRAARQEINV